MTSAVGCWILPFPTIYGQEQEPAAMAPNMGCHIMGKLHGVYLIIKEI